MILGCGQTNMDKLKCWFKNVIKKNVQLKVEVLNDIFNPTFRFAHILPCGQNSFDLFFKNTSLDLSGTRLGYFS